MLIDEVAQQGKYEVGPVQLLESEGGIQECVCADGKLCGISICLLNSP